MEGKIVLSCGHECGIRPNGFPVRVKSEECDAATGFHAAVIYAQYCRDCYARALAEYPQDLLFEEWEEDEYFAEYASRSTPPRSDHQPTHHKSAPQEGKV